MSDIVHIYGCRAIGFHNAPNRDNDCTCGATIESLQEQVAALEALLRKAAEGTWWDGNEPFTIQRLESWIVAALAERNE